MITHQDNYLIHYGIKGQKWGVRRFQEKDGTLTPAGEERYKDSESSDSSSSSTKKKSKYRTKLEEKYMSKGFDQKDAERAATNRIRAQTILGVVAGVTVAAASAYAINKYVKERTDQVLKSGAKLQRIEGTKKIFGSKNRNLHDSFYVTDNEYDNKNYMEAFGNQKKRLYGKAYKMEIDVTSDIKVASQKKARDTFTELLLNNGEFQDSIDPRNIVMDLRGKHEVDVTKYLENYSKGKKIPDRIKRKIYDNYNSNLVGKAISETEETNRKIFYDALKKQGYGGVQDINDLKWSHLRGKNPLIIFDKKKTNVTKIEDITDKMSNSIEKASYDRMSRLVGKQRIASLLPAIAGVSVGAAVTSPLLVNISANKKPNKKPNKNSSKQSYVERYKKEHPNTTLTDAQIEKIFK